MQDNISDKPDKSRRRPGAARPSAPSKAAAALGADFGARVRGLRRQRRWSLDVLAAKSGVSRSMLSEIERNEAIPTLALALAIAHTFGVRLGDLVEGSEGDSLLEVIRANDPVYDYRTQADCTIRTLSPLHPDRSIEFYRLDFSPGGALRSQPHFVGVREVVYVDKGRVRVESGTDHAVLIAGDSVSYAADVPHAIVNVGRSRARAYLIDVFPPGSGA